MHLAQMRIAAVGLLALAAACWRSPPASRPLEVVRSAPALGDQAPPLLLNDSLTVYFSEPLLPLSITSDSVAMIDERGLQVPGSLRTGANWVAFVPTPPLTPGLDDGSFRPGGRYRLVIAGSPRPDALRSIGDVRLSGTVAFDVRIATLEQAPAGLPAPLRPPAGELPLVLRPTDGLEQLPANAPRLQLHFTRPVLPTSVSVDAFEVLLLVGTPGEPGEPLEPLQPRSARVVTSRLDELPGCTIEIDLGVLPRHPVGKPAAGLRGGDWVSVGLRRGRSALMDYAGNAPLPATPQVWTVIDGDTKTLGAWPWPDGATRFATERALEPCFEVHDGTIRPRVRTEAGNGRLGVFQPRSDLLLRPGQPFDRGDGTLVVSDGPDFPFLAIDVPQGVTVRVDASAGPVRLRSCADVYLAGTLQLESSGTAMPPRRAHAMPVDDLIAAAPVAIVAAGDIHLTGSVRTTALASDATTPFLLATAGDLHLQGELPFRTILAIEETRQQGSPRIHGSRGQTVVFAVRFTHGVAAGADLPVAGLTSWLQIPLGHDGAVLGLVDASPELRFGWQSAPPESVRRDQPDVTVGRVGRLQAIADRERLVVAPETFVRLSIDGRVAAGQAVPMVREIRLLPR